MKLPVIKEDKANHFIYGYLIYSASLLFMHPFFAFTFVLATALTKELADKLTQKGTPDIADIAYTVAGPLPILIIQALNL